MFYPANYIEPVFRPPSEARSLILQVTNGCSWNRCSFCEMYTAPQKKFRPKAEEEVIAEIKACGERLPNTRRVFLADGDAMALSVRRLTTILEAIREYLPTVTRVSSYCLPRNLKKKTTEELAQLSDLGLGLLYVGAESGDDEILKKIDKGETYASTLDALLKIKQAEIKSSVMIINGMGGQQYSQQHAINSASLVNEAQPDYLATLSLFFNNDAYQKVTDGFDGEFQQLTTLELYKEMELFLSKLDLNKSIFRSDHISNSLVLKGVLGRDKDLLLQQVRYAIAHSTDIPMVNLPPSVF